MQRSFSPSPKIATGEAKLADHGGQKTRRNFLTEVFDDGFARAVVKCNVTSLAAFGFNTNRHGTRRAQLAHPLNEFPAFDIATVGQECPNINSDLIGL